MNRESLTLREYRIAVIGLGYVGLPLQRSLVENLISLAKLNVNETRISELIHLDRTLEVTSDDFMITELWKGKDEMSYLESANVFIVTVPTPFDKNKYNSF